MVEFRERDDVERWLEGRPRKDAIVLATRAPLRVLPLLAIATENRQYWNEDIAVDIVFSVFRAMGTRWVVSKYSTQGGKLHAGPIDAVASASESARAVAIAAGDADAGAPGDAAADTVYRAVSRDATALEQGMSVEVLADGPLWPGKTPGWVARNWNILKAHLLARDEDWQVWTDWYEARLKGGGRTRQAIEIARVTLPEELWQQGPKAVNVEIRRLIEADKAKSRSDRSTLKQRPSSHSFDWRDGKLQANAVTAPPFDAFFAETLAGELRRKSAEALAALTGNSADEVVTRAIQRLGEILILPADQTPVGILLVDSDTITSHARAYADAGNERERGIRAVLDDLATSVQRLVACYPQIKAISANQLELEVQPAAASAIEARIDDVAAIASQHPLVAPSARDALEMGKNAAADLGEKIGRTHGIVRAHYIQALGKVVSARLLVATNFVSAAAQKAASEVKGLGADTWSEMRKTLPKAAAKGLAKATEKGIEHSANLAGLWIAVHIVDAWAAIALLVPSLGPHARKVEEIATPPIDTSASQRSPNDQA